MFGIFRRKKTPGESPKVDYIVVGLGNPGAQYEMSRHNAGFMAVDLLAEALGAGRINRGKCRALYTICTCGDKTLLLMKPQTYMNLSGESVRDMAASYGVPPQNIIVLYDDINIDSGRIRVKRAGSDGGHNGIKNIIYHLQSDAFPRVKIGVGAPGGEDMKKFVLDKLDSMAYYGVEATPQATISIVTNGVDTAMQNFNGKVFAAEA